MSDFVGVDVTGIPELKEYLGKLPPAIQDAIIDDVSKYLLGVFRKYPPPNHNVTRKQAYGKYFFTDRQRKWFFWALETGRIHVPYTRTREMRNAWRIEGKGMKSIIVNETQAAVFTMGDDTRARFSKLVGWQTVGEIIKERNKQILTTAQQATNKAIKKTKKK